MSALTVDQAVAELSSWGDLTLLPDLGTRLRTLIYATSTEPMDALRPGAAGASDDHSDSAALARQAATLGPAATVENTHVGRFLITSELWAALRIAYPRASEREAVLGFH